MSSFFTIPGAQKKRKRASTTEAPKKRIAPSKAAPPRDSRPQKRPQRDDSISGSDDESDGDGPRPIEDDAASDTSGSSDGEGETAAERRLRLAERYLENIREEVVDDQYGFDAEEIDRDLIAERLQEDAAESKGVAYKELARELDFASAHHTAWKWNSSSVNGIATCYPYAYTVTKDLGLAKWKLQELPENQWPQKTNKKGKKSKKPPPPPKRRPEQLLFVKGNSKMAKDNSYQGHTSNILCVAASQDGKYVVTGGADRKIIVWDAATFKVLRTFSHHRDTVTGLTFRRGTNQMYSSSKDRTIKVWSLDELAYIETLFGHQDEVIDISSLAQERCISVGARDRTARLWKVVEETQLVFRGGGSEKKSKSKSKSKQRSTFQEGSIDRVAMIDEDTFVTGSDNGSLSLWVSHKKKPLFTLPYCHGFDPVIESVEASAEADEEKRNVPEPCPRWITALKAVPYSDVILSGSWDGCVRVWKVSADKKRLEPVGVLGSEDISLDESEEVGAKGVVKGVINDISIFERGERGKDGVCVVVGVGKEHRFGRWMKESGKNGGMVFEIGKVKKIVEADSEEETNGHAMDVGGDEE